MRRILSFGPQFKYLNPGYFVSPETTGPLFRSIMQACSRSCAFFDVHQPPPPTVAEQFLGFLLFITENFRGCTPRPRTTCTCLYFQSFACTTHVRSHVQRGMRMSYAAPHDEMCRHALAPRPAMACAFACTKQKYSRMRLGSHTTMECVWRVFSIKCCMCMACYKLQLFAL
jgi:hypothetical protein